MQYPVRVTDAKDPIYALLLCADDDSKGIVATADRLEILLAEKKLLYHLRIAPRSLGVDPSNRDGEGINPLNVVALASEIASVGWSDSEVGKAICCEVSPLDGIVEAFNVKLSFYWLRDGGGRGQLDPLRVLGLLAYKVCTAVHSRRCGIG